MINSSVFKNKYGEIHADHIILFGFLNCGGSVEFKSEALFNVLKESGVVENNFLHAQDKDMKLIILKLIKLCTSELALLMQEVDGTQKTSQTLGKEEVINATHNDIRNNNYLDPLFGANAKLSYEEWLDRSRSKPEISMLFYNSQMLRQLVFTRAAIDF